MHPLDLLGGGRLTDHLQPAALGEQSLFIWTWRDLFLFVRLSDVGEYQGSLQRVVESTDELSAVRKIHNPACFPDGENSQR